MTSSLSKILNEPRLGFVKERGNLFGKSGMSVSADEDAAHGDVDHGG
jgi:hypothetical protein